MVGAGTAHGVDAAPTRDPQTLPDPGRGFDARGPVVLAAIDDSPAAPWVARWAGELGRAAGGGVVVFTAVPVAPETRSVFGLGMASERGSLEGGALATVGRVRPILERIGVPYRVEVRACSRRVTGRGSARELARAILRAARETGAELIVVGHRADQRRPGSSVAARVLRRARVDVLVTPLQMGRTGVDGLRERGAGRGQAP